MKAILEPRIRHFLNSKAIDLLPPGAIVVNTPRGSAGLDVFEGERELNPEYVALKNTFLLPHIGSATIETSTAMGMALDKVDAVMSGKSARTLVQPRRVLHHLYRAECPRQQSIRD